ncbi:MAG: transporter substrate-binding domain-containing protein [Coprobacillus sp.]
MKKLLKVMLVMVLAVMVTACGGNSNEKTESKAETVKVTIGVSPDYAPYESLDTNNKVVGFDPDMVALFPSYLNTDGKKYEFEWVTMDFDNICTQLQAGQLDLGISGFTYAEDRVVEWSVPYTATAQVAIMKKGSSIKSAADLEGKTLAAQTSATGETVAKGIKNAKVESLKDVKIIFQGLAAGQYDAAVVDLAVAQNYVKNGDFEMLDGSLLDEKNYIVAKKGNTEMIKVINTALEKFLASEDYTKLCEKYGLKKL